MIKLVVGVDSLEDYARLIKAQTVDYHGQPANQVWTRHKPKREEELLESGSIYRVIKNRICCRQRIIGFERVEHREKGSMCLILTEPTLVRTVSTPKRPFQGWRYLKVSDAPADVGVFIEDEDTPPEEMIEDLSASGLL